MSLTMSPDEIVKSLVAQGVPRKAAERAAGNPPAVEFMQVIGEPLPFPIRLTVPWSALVSENRRFASRGSRIFMTAEYKAARAKLKTVALAAMTASDGVLFGPLARPLSLVARVWFPDHRVHDAPNFAGATHNALTKIVFVDDQWLYDTRWIRAGVDVDHPRAEMEIGPV